ncbi:hypothetical protein K435DRAFT_972981 [Dendrothele bispora CBS 962.96]|uniref:Uncharacterized protein n=1 Tax=Dendrothele bispora (strain CBS 962.96) TaxID=1314807 RepID=A0A4S8KVF9_DENBC|nr:hypothetical protein K435DRAFT_972981 [Dendrothele bispora CBS 962.96]
MPLSRSDTVLVDDYDDQFFNLSQATLPPSSSQGSVDFLELTDSDDDLAESRPPPTSSSPCTVPIEISSDEDESLYETPYASSTQTKFGIDLDSDDDLPSMTRFAQEIKNRVPVSRRTSFNDPSSSELSSKRRYSDHFTDDATESDTDATPSPPKKSRLYSTRTRSPSPVPKPKKRASKTAEDKARAQEEKEKKAAARAHKKALTAAEKARKEQQKILKRQLQDIDKLKKQEEKEQKQAIRKANNRRTDKKKAVSDMTIVLATTFGKDFADLLNEKMSEFNAKVKLRAVPPILQGYDCVLFRRWIHRQYDTDERAFVPVEPSFEKEEPAALLRLSKDKLWDLVQRNELQEVVHLLRAAYELPRRSQIFLLVFGLEKVKEQNREKWQRIEDTLTCLQFDEHTYHICVEDDQEAVDRLYNIAADYAIKEEKLVERSHLPFCPNVNIKAAEANDVYRQMLDQINRLTISAARGIKTRYPTMRDLLDKYAELDGNQRMQDKLLEDCPVTQRADGSQAARGGHKLGPALSTRVSTVMFSKDPQELAVKDSR